MADRGSFISSSQANTGIVKEMMMMILSLNFYSLLTVQYSLQYLLNFTKMMYKVGWIRNRLALKKKKRRREEKSEIGPY